MIKDVQFPHPMPAQASAGFSPQQAGTKSAHVVFILDDSGSMQSCRAATIDGFNEFLEGQKNSEIPTFISLYKFDGSYVNRLHNATGVHAVTPLNMETYNPRGGTNLNDAICEVILQINGQLASVRAEDRSSVTIVILTDGEENSSRRFTSADVKSMVEKCEGANWGFFFLGANIDAFQVGSVYGFSQANTLQYKTSNMGATMVAAASAVNRMNNARSAGLDTAMAYAASTFTEEERKEAN